MRYPLGSGGSSYVRGKKVLIKMSGQALLFAVVFMLFEKSKEYEDLLSVFADACFSVLGI